jgi:hypothetical protein
VQYATKNSVYSNITLLRVLAVQKLGKGNVEAWKSFLDQRYQYKIAHSDSTGPKRKTWMKFLRWNGNGTDCTKFPVERHLEWFHYMVSCRIVLKDCLRRYAEQVPKLNDECDAIVETFNGSILRQMTQSKTEASKLWAEEGANCAKIVKTRPNWLDSPIPAAMTTNPKVCLFLRESGKGRRGGRLGGTTHTHIIAHKTKR